MIGNPEQFAGGALPDAGSNGEVRAHRTNSPQGGQGIASGSAQTHDSTGSGTRGHREPVDSGALYSTNCVQEFFSIRDLAARWRVSRPAVYGYLRGWPVIDFAPAPGRKGHKLVAAETVRQIERERVRVMR